MCNCTSENLGISRSITHILGSPALLVSRNESKILTPSGRGLIAAPMINASTMLIVRRRRAIAVWAVVCV